MKNKYLFTDCINVSGYLRNVIIDLTRQNFYFVPKWSGNSEDIITYDFYNFLMEEEIIFENNEIFKSPENIPNGEKPTIIETIVVENYFDNNLLEFIQEYKVRHIVYLIENDLYRAKRILESLFIEDVSSVDIHLTLDELNVNVIHLIQEIINQYPFSSFTIYPKKNKYLPSYLGNQILISEDSVFNNEGISFSSFYANFDFYFESLYHNAYYNKKLFIDSKGFISLDYSSLTKPVGTVKTRLASEMIDFCKKFWDSPKSECDICKDCEFRNMCLDNRLPYHRSERQWYHKTECNYNPYICKWKDEEGYRTLKECGVVSDENGFSIDHEKIAKINRELWGE